MPYHTNKAQALIQDLKSIVDFYGAHIEVYVNVPERGLKPLARVAVAEYHEHEGQGPFVVVIE